MARTLTVKIVGDAKDLKKALGRALVLSPIVCCAVRTDCLPG